MELGRKRDKAEAWPTKMYAGEERQERSGRAKGVELGMKRTRQRPDLR